MSWRASVLMKLGEIEAEVKATKQIVIIYDLIVRRQQEMIERLIDRAQAGDFKEYKTYVPTEKLGERDREDFYNPWEDEELAGEAVEVKGSERPDTER